MPQSFHIFHNNQVLILNAEEVESPCHVHITAVYSNHVATVPTCSSTKDEAGCRLAKDMMPVNDLLFMDALFSYRKLKNAKMSNLRQNIGGGLLCRSANACGVTLNQFFL